MINEDFCSYEVAKLLKEKGFDEECSYRYIAEPDYRTPEFVRSPIGKGSRYLYNAPTHQMAMKWLREEKNIFIVIEPHAYDYINEKNKSYVCSLWVGDNYYEYLESRDYPSYEEAVEAALKYALKNLI